MTYLTSLVIFLLGLYFIKRLTQVPVTIQLTVVTKTAETPPNEDLLESPMPSDVLDYINQESDSWARVSRKQRAHKLYATSQSWPEVLIELRREDLVNG